ncbi:MAG TPA: YdcF family protein [Verrucomicrobiae bacterium]|nr:YdcF family protein [Verrucomicrobiae bacterium]
MHASRVTKAVVVFGYKVNEGGELHTFATQRIDRAVEEHNRTGWPLIFCGSRSFKNSQSACFSEAELMKDYCQKTHSVPAEVIFTETQSTSAPENWLYLKASFPSLKEIVLPTQVPLMGRLNLLRQMIYGTDKSPQVRYAAIACSPKEFPHEQRRIKVLQCIFANYIPGFRPGKHKMLLDAAGQSCWPAFAAQHKEKCAIEHG